MHPVAAPLALALVLALAAGCGDDYARESDDEAASLEGVPWVLRPAQP